MSETMVALTGRARIAPLKKRNQRENIVLTYTLADLNFQLAYVELHARAHQGCSILRLKRVEKKIMRHISDALKVSWLDSDNKIYLELYLDCAAWMKGDLAKIQSRIAFEEVNNLLKKMGNMFSEKERKTIEELTPAGCTDLRLKRIAIILTKNIEIIEKLRKKRKPAKRTQFSAAIAELNDKLIIINTRLTYSLLIKKMKGNIWFSQKSL